MPQVLGAVFVYCIHVCVYMGHMTYRDDVKCPLFFVNIYY